MNDNKVHPMFKGAAQKLDWADYKLRDLKELVSIYGLGFVRLQASEEIDGSKKIVVKAKDIPFPRPPYIGDILRNLRGSLDHAISAMLRAVDKRDDKDYFPIGDDVPSFTNFVKIFLQKSESEKLTNFFINEIDAQKQGKSKDIWYLNQMDRANKHRQLVVVEEVVVAPIPNMSGQTTLIDNCYFKLTPGSTAEKIFPTWMNVIGFRYDKPPSLTIKFGPNEALPGEDVVKVLTRFRDNVRSVLINLQKEYTEEYPERAAKFIQE